MKDSLSFYEYCHASISLASLELRIFRRSFLKRKKNKQYSFLSQAAKGKSLGMLVVKQKLRSRGSREMDISGLEDEKWPVLRVEDHRARRRPLQKPLRAVIDLVNDFPWDFWTD